MFLGVIDSVAPIKSVRLKHGCELWFSGEILNLISQRDKAWVSFRKCKTEAAHNEFKILRNQSHYAIKKSKKDFKGLLSVDFKKIN